MSIRTAFKFVKSWIRRIGSLLLAGAIYSLILTGCVNTQGIYIGELQLQGVQNSTNKGNDTTSAQDSTVRFGYFGMCIRSSGDFSCSSTSTVQLGNKLLSDVFTQDIVTLQHATSFLPPIIALFFLLLGLMSLCAWNFFGKRRQKVVDADKVAQISRKIIVLIRVTRGFLWTSTALSLITAYSTTSTLSALQAASSIFGAGQTSSKTITPGIAIQVLQWIMFTLTAGLAAYIHFWFHPSYESELPTVNPFGHSSSTAELNQPAPTFAHPKQDDYQFPPPPPQY